MQSKCWKDWQTAHRKKEYYFPSARRQKSLLKHSKSNNKPALFNPDYALPL